MLPPMPIDIRATDFAPLPLEALRWLRRFFVQPAGYDLATAVPAGNSFETAVPCHTRGKPRSTLLPAVDRTPIACEPTRRPPDPGECSRSLRVASVPRRRSDPLSTTECERRESTNAGRAGDQSWIDTPPPLPRDGLAPSARRRATRSRRTIRAGQPVRVRPVPLL